MIITATFADQQVAGHNNEEQHCQQDLKEHRGANEYEEAIKANEYD